MADKTTHFGRAGEYHAMSELLLRGWNVAIPVVDVGDDVFVIDDKDKRTRRVQVKSAEGKKVKGRVTAAFKLSQSQLRLQQPIELFYVLLVRSSAAWRMLVIPRDRLLEIHKARGGRRKASVSLMLNVTLENDGAKGWSASLSEYLDKWPEDLAPADGGPGAKKRTAKAIRVAMAEPAGRVR